MIIDGEAGGGSARPSSPALPSIPNATVARRALLRRLDADPMQRFVLLSAPAGSGKSALLADWAGRLEVPVVWFGCQEVDGDRIVFWSRFEQALLAGLGPRGMVGAEVAGLGVGAETASAAADAIVAQLASVIGPAVIVIDDLHLAGPTPAELVALIAGMPPSIRLVVATRVDPPFSLERMRLHGTLLELRQGDLRFDAEESAEAFAATGLQLGDVELARLHELTEGWPAGVHLVALALRDRDEPRRAAALAHLAEVAASDRHLGAFLLAEVIDVLPPDLRSFLQVTALLEWFDPGLHDEITGRADGYALLEEVRARNLFLVELETDPPTYRYHHLVQEFLRSRFALEDPEGAAAVHRRAAEVHVARGDYGAALPHLLANGELDVARSLLTREAQEVASLIQPDGATVARRWLAEHGEAQLARDPAGLLDCTMALNAGGFHAEAEVWLRRWSEVEPRLGPRQRALLHAAWGQHHLFTGAPERCLVEASESRRLLELDPDDDDGWGHSLTMLEAQAPMWLGELEGARAAAAAALGRPGVPLTMALVRLPSFVAWADVVEGALRSADSAAAGAVRMADELGLGSSNFGRGEAELVLALVAHDQARVADAEAHLERALHVAEAGRPQVEVQCLLLVATLAARRGEPDRVADALGRARARFQSPSAVVLARIDEVEARLALQHGDRRSAAAAVARLPEGHVAELLRARVALAAGDRARAAEHVAAAGPSPAGLRAGLDRGLVAALVRPPGERVDAVADLTALIGEAAAEQFVRPFLDEGPELWDLVAEVPVTGHLAAFRDEVLVAARQIVPIVRVGDQSALIDPLSERELTVLRYLASRLDSSEIAAALYISVNTVRSHVKAIYRKLGVSSRPAAVARARELDLI